MAAATLDLHVVINYKILPLVPHKAAAEVSEIGNHRKPIGELGCCESRMAEWWLELCFFGVVTTVAVATWSVTLQL